MDALAGSEARVAEELNRLGIASEVRVMPTSTRSAAEAAAAVGCDVSQIVKSLIFRSIKSDEPILVLASGANRVDEDRLAEIVEGPVQRATAEFVRARTGYAIGGVPPSATSSGSTPTSTSTCSPSCRLGRGGVAAGRLLGDAG